MSPQIDTIFYNAQVLTMDSRIPVAELVGIHQGRIVYLGNHTDSRHLGNANTRRLDCQGGTLIPGFHDAHLHLLALASTLAGVDCSPSVVNSLPMLQAELRKRCASTAIGNWVRGHNYDDFYLEKHQHPNRWDLDAVSLDHPIRLDHRSGHACVLNSAALKYFGINRNTPNPIAGIIHRDIAGDPTGLLFEMNSAISQATKNTKSHNQTRKRIRDVNQLLLSQGITSVQDASFTNFSDRYSLFLDLLNNNDLCSRVTLMMGIDSFGMGANEALHRDPANSRLSLGAVKIMLTSSTGALQPSEETLREAVLEVHKHGFQIAIHAIENQAISAAISAIEHAQSIYPRPGARHRIEHCSECPPDLAHLVKQHEVTVVTQPSFLYYSGDRYLRTVKPEIQPHLYPFGTLLRKGVSMAASSDAPVTSPNPLLGIYASTVRRTRDGVEVNPAERITSSQALELFTLGAAHSAFQEPELGSIRVGKKADLVLLDGNPVGPDPHSIKELRVLMTVIDGLVVWQA